MLQHHQLQRGHVFVHYFDNLNKTAVCVKYWSNPSTNNSDGPSLASKVMTIVPLFVDGPILAPDIDC